MEENKKIEDKNRKVSSTTTPESNDIKTNNLKQDKGSEYGSKGSSVSSNNKLLAVIRISGMVKVKRDIVETLDRLRLRRKYACVLVNSKNRNIIGILKKVKFYVAYGLIERDVLVELVKARGMISSESKDSETLKIGTEKVVSELMSGKSLKDLGLKPFFRLHPPRKGIKSKLQYPKGVLGDNGSKINDLIRRML